MLLGIPFYTRLWELDQQGNIAGSRAIMQSAIPNLLRRQRYHRLYDSKARQYRYVYRAHSNTYMFWHESIDVIKARMALARREKLAGVGFWRYGFESPKVWKKLKAY
jgi:spore germination protein YaaH